MTDLDALVRRALRELCAAVQDHLREHPDVGEADLLIGGERVDRRAELLREQYEAEKAEKRLAKVRLD
jgi:hypothetical protein